MRVVLEPACVTVVNTIFLCQVQPQEYGTLCVREREVPWTIIFVTLLGVHIEVLRLEYGFGRYYEVRSIIID
jgi:hypothetical protein